MRPKIDSACWKKAKPSWTSDEIWAAAGHPAAVYSTTYDELLEMTGATEIDVTD